MAERSRSLASTIFKAGLLAGTLDILIAFIQYYRKTGKNPVAVLKFIASGIFGKEAFTGGNIMGLYGLLFHFIIAFIWTIIFFFLYPRIAIFRNNIITPAVIFGLLVWAVMNKIVLPLSNAPAIPFDLEKAIVAMLILIAAIGLPLSLFAKRYYSAASAR